MVLRKVNSALYYPEVLTSEEFQNVLNLDF